MEDGGHFELSPMYQSLILDDLLDIYQFLNIYQKSLLEHEILFQEELANYIQDSFNWLASMCHPDGQVAFFNDSCFNVASSLHHLEKRVRSTDGLSINIKRKKNYTYLQKSGFFNLSAGEFSAILNVSQISPVYQPGHSHADSLSFEMCFGLQRVFVNSGISTYEDNTLRHSQRSTKLHNTVSVDSKNSSDVWKSFRVGAKAKTTVKSITKFSKSFKICALHKGYSSVLREVCHQRSWELSENGFTVKDMVSGKYKHAYAYYYLHPDIEINQSGTTLRLNLGNKRSLSVAISTSEFEIQRAKWYPEFNTEVDSYCIKIPVLRSGLVVEVTKIEL